MSNPHRSQSPNPVTMLVSYYPKPGKEDEFLPLLEKHWPTLDRLGLVTKVKPQIWRAFDIRANRSYFVESFQWKNGEASGIAHQTPEVMAVWEPMGPILEKMQLSQLEPLGSKA